MFRLLDDLFGLEPGEVEKVTQGVEAMTAHKLCELGGERGHIRRGVLAITQRDR